MSDTLTRAPERDETEQQHGSDSDPCVDAEVVDGSPAETPALLPSLAIERFEAWAALHGRPAAALDVDRLVASRSVHDCVRRFATVEANVTDPSLDGLGRVSGARVPRLGGLLHGRVFAGSAAAALVRTAVEQTIRAGYLAAVLTEQVSSVPVHELDADVLWHSLLRLSYRIPRDAGVAAWELCGLDDYWVGVLAQCGLDRDAHRMAAGVHTPLSRAIRGLAGVGVALAIAERGGQRDRRDGQSRRRTRPDRRRGPIPPVPHFS